MYKIVYTKNVFVCTESYRLNLRPRNRLNVPSTNSVHSLKKTPKRIIKRHRSGKTIDTLKKLQKAANDIKENEPLQAVVGHNKNLRELKIILTKCDEKENFNSNSSTISVDSDMNSSVEFVSEEKPSREATQIAKPNAKIVSLEKKNRAIELHVVALQRHVIAQNQVPIEIQAGDAETDEESRKHAQAETQANANANASANIDEEKGEQANENRNNNEEEEGEREISNIRLSDGNMLSESFIENQLHEWHQNGELDNLFHEYTGFVNGVIN